MHATFTAFVCSGFTLTYTHYTVLSRVGNIKAHSHCGDRTSTELAARSWDHVQNYSPVRFIPVYYYYPHLTQCRLGQGLPPYQVAP